MSTLKVIVTGLIGQYPLGGVTWDYLQYVLGLQQLGHDVYYFEDTGQWPYNPVEGGVAGDCSFNAEYPSMPGMAAKSTPHNRNASMRGSKRRGVLC